MLVILSLYTYAIETPIGFSVKCVRNFNLKTAEYTVMEIHLLKRK